jgi:cytochrome P450 family 9
MMFYELAKNPGVQQQLQLAIDKVASNLNEKPITYETLQNIKFLDMVVNETLRMWSSTPQTDRSCVKHYSLDLGGGKTMVIKKGQIIVLPIYHIHHDPNYFPDPKKFDP